MANCPSCGAQQPAGAAFCGQCGKPLSQQSPAQPFPAQTPPPPPPPSAPPYPGQPQGQRPPYPAPPPGAPPFQAQRPGVPPYQAPPPGAPQVPGQPPYGQQYRPAQGAPKKKIPVILFIALPIFVIVIGVAIWGLSTAPSSEDIQDIIDAGRGQQSQGDTGLPRTDEPTAQQGGQEPEIPAEAPIPMYAGRLGGEWEHVAISGTLLATANGNQVVLSEVNDGGVSPLNAFARDSRSGKVIDLVIGDAWNQGSLDVFATFENGLLLIDEDGNDNWIEGQISGVRIGDFDGDGNNEVLLRERDAEGEEFLSLWRYGFVEGGEMIAQVPAGNAPYVYPTPVYSGEHDQLIAYENGKVSVFNWDNDMGLEVVTEFRLDGSAPVRWVTGDTDGTIGISRGGATPYIEWWEPDTGTFSQMGMQRMPGEGGHIAISGFFDEDGWLFVVDEDTDYFVY